ncbi:MAG: hypothetical protein FWG98_01160 [Candidatus Cloacimonetes bacterium]|nr:hypothetical protein [Candidatus Cloacimonadota bacterium]
MAKRVKMTDLVQSQSGKSDNGKYVFVSLNNGQLTVKRKHTPVRLTSFHEAGATMMKNASIVYRNI